MLYLTTLFPYSLIPLTVHIGEFLQPALRSAAVMLRDDDAPDQGKAKRDISLV